MKADFETTFSRKIVSDAITASDHILCKTDLDVKTASIFDLKTHQIAELRKLWLHGVDHDTTAVGWLPTSVFNARALTNDITAVYRNNDLVGWCLHGQSHARKVMKIFQIWVRPDARIIEHGRALISDLTLKTIVNKCSMLEAWVAEDLPANLFWLALGFTRDVWRWGRGASLRKIYRWTKTAAIKRGEVLTAAEWQGVEKYDNSKWRHTINRRTVQAMAETRRSAAQPH